MSLRLPRLKYGAGAMTSLIIFKINFRQFLGTPGKFLFLHVLYIFKCAQQNRFCLIVSGIFGAQK